MIFTQKKEYKYNGKGKQKKNTQVMCRRRLFTIKLMFVCLSNVCVHNAWFHARTRSE